MVELFVNSEDPDQMQRSSASDLGLPVTRLGVSSLQRINTNDTFLIFFITAYVVGSHLNCL